MVARGSKKEVVGGLGEDVADGEKEESVDGKEDGPDSVAVEGKETIVEWEKDEEGPGEGAVIVPVGRHEGGEFPQGLEGHEREQEKRTYFSKKRGADEEGDHEPPRVGALTEVLAELGILLEWSEAAEGGDEKGRESEDSEEEVEEELELGVGEEFHLVGS